MTAGQTWSSDHVGARPFSQRQMIESFFAAICPENETPSTRSTPGIPKVSLSAISAASALKGVFHGAGCAVAHEHSVVEPRQRDAPCTRPGTTKGPI
jgi:hypothetical protein